MSARALEWLILNASRFREIAGAKRREVDLQLKRWTIPPERMKRDIEHVVPLSDDDICPVQQLASGRAQWGASVMSIGGLPFSNPAATMADERRADCAGQQPRSKWEVREPHVENAAYTTSTKTCPRAGTVNLAT
jgi:hypothetical protein